MLMKTAEAFRDRTTYTRLENGRWRAEFHGAVHVSVEGPSLERCRFDALDALDAQLCEWLLQSPTALRHGRNIFPVNGPGWRGPFDVDGS